MNRHLSITLIFLLIVTFSLGQTSPNIEWKKRFGGSNNDIAVSIQQTADNGYIVGGYSNSTDGMASGNHGANDFFIVKTNSLGNIIWEKSFGGSSDDFANSIQQTSDGGYIVAGTTTSNDDDVSGFHGYVDAWIVKLDRTGAIVWQKCFGASATFHIAHSIQQTVDGGYIMSGYLLPGVHGNDDFWVVKLNSTGSIVWEKSLGGSGHDLGSSVQQTSDGGYIVSGYSHSNDGDVNGNHGLDDAWVVKLSGTGTIVWQKSLGGSNYDHANLVQQTADGGYILAGGSESNDGIVSGNHGLRDA